MYIQIWHVEMHHHAGFDLPLLSHLKTGRGNKRNVLNINLGFFLYFCLYFVAQKSYKALFFIPTIIFHIYSSERKKRSTCLLMCHHPSFLVKYYFLEIS